MLVKNCSIVGLYWGGYNGHDARVVSGSIAETLELVRDGRIAPTVRDDCVFRGIESVPDAFEFLASRKSIGKVVVEM